MRVVHEPAGTGGTEQVSEPRALATNVEVADSVLSQARGLMFRKPVPEGFALVMELGGGSLLTSGPSRQFVHMLFVRVPLDVVWLVDEEVVQVASLSPWTGFGLARADHIIEFPAGGADGVAVGDTVRLEE